MQHVIINSTQHNNTIFNFLGLNPNGYHSDRGQHLMEWRSLVQLFASPPGVIHAPFF
jgi:hypothetical protein